jgi:uncharacterized membrane protein
MDSGGTASGGTASGSSPPVHTRSRQAKWAGIASAGRRVLVSLAGGIVAGIGFSVVAPLAAGILLGWDVAAVLLLVWVWVSVRTCDDHDTWAMARRDDPSTGLADLVVVGAGIAVLGAVAFALIKAGHSHGGEKAALIALGVLSVVLSWAVVHTVFMLQYASAYYSGDGGGIDFNEQEPPTYLDFAYLSFTIGMTFQVSDTNITTKTIRRIALRHALVSYLFGAVIIGLVINVVASLL